MDVGHGCIIADKWIPEGIDTGLKDINGKSIMTANKVSLRGCTSSTAIVGIGGTGMEHSKYWLYFGGRNGSVGWRLNQQVVEDRHIEVIED